MKKKTKEKMKYVICRSNMGVHAGELSEKESTKDVKVLYNVRRLWRWYSPGVSLSIVTGKQIGRAHV